MKGFHTPVPAGGLPDDVNGPVVAPGHYRVTLEYGGRELSESFDVSLDPRIRATQRSWRTAWRSSSASTRRSTPWTGP